MLSLNQNDLFKLAAGGVVGYLGASFLLPHRGFAKVTVDNPPGSPGGPTANIDTGQDLTPQQIKHPGAWPKGGKKQDSFQPFTPDYITGGVKSSGPINTGICKMINLPGCDTVVDPNTGASVAAHCDLFGMKFPVDCWVLAAAGILIAILALK